MPLETWHLVERLCGVASLRVQTTARPEQDEPGGSSILGGVCLAQRNGVSEEHC